MWKRGRAAWARRSLEAIGDTALGQVVGRELDEHFVADQHPDAVLAHLAGGVAEDLVIVLEPDAEHRVGEKLHNLSAHFKQFFFRQKSASLVSARLNGGAFTPARSKREGGEPTRSPADSVDIG